MPKLQLHKHSYSSYFTPLSFILIYHITVDNLITYKIDVINNPHFADDGHVIFFGHVILFVNVENNEAAVGPDMSVFIACCLNLKTCFFVPLNH